eukprot:m.171907 g.171907  ORF g.171907 m.171907 type:complete len:300 (-) comp15359_c0_seq5:1496-2395(-)
MRVNFVSVIVLSFIPYIESFKAPHVLKWEASPFGFEGGPYNKTALNNFINDLEIYRDIFDEICLVSYILLDPITLPPNVSGLQIGNNTDKVIEALQTKDWEVSALIGSGWHNYDIAYFRYYFSSPRFLQDLVPEVEKYGYKGLNFDFEPQNCDTVSPPCSLKDTAQFAKFLTNLKKELDNAWLLNITVSVDTSQSFINKDYNLNGSKADIFYSMDTYYEPNITQLNESIYFHINTVGLNRYGLGICPGCANFTKRDAKEIMNIASELCIANLGVWGLPTEDWIKPIADWRNYLIDNCYL